MAIITIRYTILIFYFLPSHFDLSYAVTCSNHKFTSKGSVYTSCKDLPHLSAQLHWTYNSTMGVAKIAYRARQQGANGWVAWAINPNQIGMVGSEALVAFVNSNGSVTWVYPVVDSFLRWARAYVTERQIRKYGLNLVMGVSVPSR
ncbi:hypothetical protein R6Q57_008876 [Mikania cordata]